MALLALVSMLPAASAGPTEPSSDATLIDKVMIGDYKAMAMRLGMWQVTSESNPTYDYYLASLTAIQKVPHWMLGGVYYWFRWGRSSLYHYAPEIVDFDPPGGQVGDVDVTYTMGVGVGPQGPTLGFSVSWTNHIDGWWTVTTGWYYTRGGDYREISWRWDPANIFKDIGKLSVGSEGKVQDGWTYYLQARVVAAGATCTTYVWPFGCFSWEAFVYDTGFREFLLPDYN